MTGQRSFERDVAVGDPQAPMATFLAILEAHGLLGGDGKLAPDVHLVTMGDYFDWGGPGDRARAAESALALLEWLTAHPKDQVTLLLGNHDLARVGELSHMDDDAFRRAQEEADAAYLDQRPERDVAAFSAATGLATWELASRDFSTFEARQRDAVEGLLREGRLDVAYAPAPDLLLTHAGVTRSELATLRVARGADAPTIARALSGALRGAVETWRGGPLLLPGLHQPGDATSEGRGMFYHRPEVRPDASPYAAAGARAPLSRRYDVASLPLGITQGIGHIRDAKSRTLLQAPPRDADEPEGALHHARVHGRGVTYARGAPPAAAADEATLLFLDGGMQHTPPTRYELYDLVHRTVLARSART